MISLQALCGGKRAVGAVSIETNPEGHSGGYGRVSQIADRDGLRRHLNEIVRSAPFKGSKRSQDFLKHVVETALLGRLELLKERTIGVELFGRPPHYDTGEDAIVRVTASDVRRRLGHYYGELEGKPEFRIDLPLGAYVPEFRCLSEVEPVASLAPQPLPDIRIRRAQSGAQTRSLYPLALLVVIALLIASILFRFPNTETVFSSANKAPWAALLNGATPLTIVTSDTDLLQIEDITHHVVSLDQYMNRKYVTQPEALDENTRRICSMLRGDHAPTIDAEMALNIVNLAHPRAQQFRVRPARSLSFTDIQTDDNFVFFGSPRSDPWVSLFNEQLDFSFKYDDDRKGEIIVNRHPRAGELPVYVPTVRRGAFGDAFAIAAFLQNPRQKGNVLIFAGSTGEATFEAGRLMTDFPALNETLRRGGISASDARQHFEMLLRLNTIGGSTHNSEVLAVHRLPS